MRPKKLPEIYAYIFRNIMQSSNGLSVTTQDQVFKAVNRTIYRAPKYVLRQILYEFTCEYKVLKKLDESRFLIVNNKITQAQLERLKENIFPINI